MLPLPSWLRRTSRPHQRPLRKYHKLWLEPLEDRTLFSVGGLYPSVPAAMRTNMVEGLYQILLNRTGASTEISSWVNDLQNGLTAAQLANGFLGSTEYGTDIVRDHYVQLLGREPEAGITDSWLPLLQSAGGYEPMTIRVLASAEYHARSGGDAQQWLTALYSDVLGRQPDPSGWTNWLAQLQAGATTQSVAAGFVNSEEEHMLSVEGAYRLLLGRAPEPAGLDYWMHALGSGLTTEGLVADIVGSAEFAEPSQNMSPSAMAEMASMPTARHGKISPFADPNILLCQCEPAIRVTPTYFRMTEQEGTTVQVATFSDPDGFTNNYRASIYWGDNTPASAGTIGQVGNLHTVNGTHTYAADGTYTVTVCVVEGPAPGVDDCGVANTFGTVTEELVPVLSNCSCKQAAPLAKTNANAAAGDPAAAGFSAAGIRYNDGAVRLNTTDLSSDGFGQPWAQTRDWTNVYYQSPAALNGSGVMDAQLPFLQQTPNNAIVVVTSGTDSRVFDTAGSNYQEEFFLQDQLTHNTGNSEFIFTDTQGDQIHFYDFSTTSPGQFKSFVDPYGNVTSVTSHSGTQITEIQRSNTVGSTTITESYLYSYISGGVNQGFLQNETLRRQVNGGSWTTVRQVQYSYYDGSQAHGNQHDLMLAQVEDGSGNVLDTMYYRYYLPGDANGYSDGLKYAFGAQSYARLVAALGTNVDSLSDTQVAPYADQYSQYDQYARVMQAVIQGAGCSSCSGGLGTFTYQYGDSGNAVGYNNWAIKTIETLPDNNQNTVYTNAYGEPMLKVYKDVGSGLSWDTFFQYDSSGRLILQASPSAVTGYNDTQANLGVTLASSSGLIQTTDYGTSTTATSTTAGDVTGYYKDTKIQRGSSGSLILQDQTQYFSQTGGGVTIYPTATQKVYRNTDGTGAETTSYTYTWFSGTTMMQSMAVSSPLISSSQNGPGSADVQTTVYDTYSRPIWTKDADGFINYTAYDQATGAVVKTITDVNTNDTGDFQNLPSGWTTPSGGGLELITQYQVDALGRTTQLTDPNGNVTYTVYNDTNYESLVYPGWNSTTHLPTGPTQVYREDRPGSYTETLTMSATPHLTNNLPDGSEAISSIQSLSRSYTNSAGQVVSKDDYFNLSGVTYSTSAHIGTLNTNYYETTYAYDSRGRLNTTTTPNGTLYVTNYDGLDRTVSTQVGTSTGNLVTTANYVYDNNTLGGSTQVGDGDLTQVISHPGGGAADRVTEKYYDWRDRVVATKDGVQGTEDTTTHRPIMYTVYDNLGEATTQQHYDGDGVTITSTNGVPNAPSSSLLREQTTTAYDDQGRGYQTITYDVNQTTGGVSSTGLTTNTYYNHRGQVIETSNPGGLVDKSQYDGAGWMIEDYTTDGAGGTSWTAASSVANDNVLQQTDTPNTQYDSDGNVILVTTRQRFHDETTLGALGNPTTAPKARVSYVASYYDAANRLTATVDVGTNGGSAWTRPSTPPSPSDTVLVTSYGYAADNMQLVQLTGSPTGGTFTLTFNGQTTSNIAYNASAATVQTALQNLSTIGSGNALVAPAAQVSNLAWAVRFAGTLAGSVQPALTGNGSGLTGGTSPSVAITVTSLGGDAGRQQQVTDPRGIITKTDYDWLGRTLRTVEAFSTFNPSSSGDKTTEYTYDGDSNMLTLQADLAGGAYEQTAFVYGVTTPNSGVNSNDILGATKYPDPSTGNPSSSQQETYTVNALGQRLTFTDRNGNVHTYVYDVLGRQTSDQITTLGSGVDTTVLRIDIAFDTGDRPYLYTSYASTSGGTIVNQVKQAYNGLGQLITEYQSHSGAVTGSTPNVQYSYVDLANGANNSRLTSMTYPNSPNPRVINFNYNSGVDTTISRLSSISDSSATLESYKYLGLATVVERDHPQNNVNLTYISQTGGTGDAGDKYTGLDRFGRVVEQNWYNTSTSSSTDDFKYTYDRDSNRLTRTNVVNSNFNEQYGYDNLNQLTSFARGSHTITWSLDALGNFASITTNGGSPVNNTFNKQNEETQAGSANLAFDHNGNTTTDDQGHTLIYDAWNRLVQVKNGGTVLTSYGYDALGRRITENPGTLRDIYFSSAWQVLEEDTSGTMQDQYVWSPVYVDAMIERDTSSQRLYVQQDANWNVTALIDTSGNVQERYIEDPYGVVTILDPNWNIRSGSSFGWVYLHQGGRYDNNTGLYDFRNREYSPTLGRWMQLDPMRYGAGDGNLYRYVRNDPINVIDPLGLAGGVPGHRPPWGEKIGQGFGTWWNYGCSESERKAVGAALFSACTCVDKALQVVEGMWLEFLRMGYRSVPMRLLRENRDYYLAILHRMSKGCHGTDHICINCHSDCAPGCWSGRNAYVSIKGGIRPVGTGWSPPCIHLCERAFNNPRWPLEEIIWHEFGRVFAWDELTENDTNTIRDVYVMDWILRVLCRDYSTILRMYEAYPKYNP